MTNDALRRHFNPLLRVGVSEGLNLWTLPTKIHYEFLVVPTLPTHLINFIRRNF